MADVKNAVLPLSQVNQIGIVVKDSNGVMESWTSLFGIGPWRVVEFDITDVEGRPGKVKLCFANLGGVQIELIEPVVGRIFHSQHLEEHGEGLHHMGFYVDDVDAEAKKVVAAGGEVLSSMPGRYAYLGTGGPGGVIFEVIRRPDQV
jgi:methylmalonyl-CoA/ethylmalonyl-CoA epimerase